MSNGIGAIIKGARKKLGLTQSDVAKEIGVTPTAISRYENENRCPDYPTCCRLSSFLHIPLDSLMTDDIQSWFDAGVAVGEESTVASSTLTKEVVLLSIEEDLLLYHFSELNSQGQQEAMKRIDEMTRLDEYKRKDGD